MKPATMTHPLKSSAVYSSRGAALPVNNKALRLCSWESLCNYKYGSCHCYDYFKPSAVTLHCLLPVFVALYQTIETGVAKHGLSWNQALKVKRSGTVKFGSWVMWSEISWRLSGHLQLYTLLLFVAHTPVDYWWAYPPSGRVTGSAGLSLYHPSFEPIIDQ